MSNSVRYITTLITEGNHASFEIPDYVLHELGANKRAPLKITVNKHTYQSTATGVGGKCLVVFPMRDRAAAGVSDGDRVSVTLEKDDGYRYVEIPRELTSALKQQRLSETFQNLSYYNRKRYARLVAEAKTEITKSRRLAKILVELQT